MCREKATAEGNTFGKHAHSKGTKVLLVINLHGAKKPQSAKILSSKASASRNASRKPAPRRYINMLSECLLFFHVLQVLPSIPSFCPFFLGSRPRQLQGVSPHQEQLVWLWRLWAMKASWRTRGKTLHRAWKTSKNTNSPQLWTSTSLSSNAKRNLQRCLNPFAMSGDSIRKGWVQHQHSSVSKHPTPSRNVFNSWPNFTLIERQW